MGKKSPKVNFFQFIAYGDEFLDKEKVDGIVRNISLTRTDFLQNTLNIIRYWRVFYYNQLREQIDTKSWLKHGEGSFRQNCGITRLRRLR